MQSAKAQIDSLVQSLSAQATSARVVDLDRIRIDFMSRVGISVAQSIQNIEKIAKMA
jgi:adenylylsulfate kinase-like enzyme